MTSTSRNWHPTPQGLAFLISLFVMVFGVSSTAWSQTRVSSYAELRALQCTPGDLAEIASGRFAGAFRCRSQSELPRGAIDDGGLQFDIAGDGDYWLRDDFNTESAPIQLNWFEWVADRTRIDSLFRNLASDFQDLFVQAPSSSVSVDTLFWQDGFDANTAFRKFYFLESDQKVNIVHTGSVEPVAMLVLENYTHVKIGGPSFNLEFHGKHPGASCPYPLSGTETCGGRTSTLRLSNGEDAKGILTFRQNTTNGVLLDFQADCRDADAYCVYTGGGGDQSSARTRTVSVKGTFRNGGLSINGGVVNAHTDITATDPHAAGQGWKGTPYPDNNGCRENYEKNKAMVRVHDADKWTGSVVLRYGWAKWFSVDVDSVGSPTDRLHIQLDSLGWTGPSSASPGTRVDVDGCAMQAGKPDPWFDVHGDGSPTRFLKITELPGSNFALTRSLRLEATSSGQSWVTCCADFELDGLPGSIEGRVENSSDQVRDMIFRGGNNPVTGTVSIGANFTVLGGEFCDISVQNANGSGRPPTSNAIRDLTIGAGCDISVMNAPTGITTLRNITFAGSARRVVDLRASGNYTIEVPSGQKLKAPVGSTIENSGGGAQLVCNGRTQSLPYTFDGIDDDCEGETSSSTSPPPPPNSQQIDLVQGWNLVSSFVQPADGSVESVLSPIVDDIVLVKDQDGNVYSPEFGINTIGNWQPLEAYQFNVRKNSSLVIEGNSTGVDTPISLRQGWNMIPVLLSEAAPVDECLFSIQDELVMAKDNLGQIYNPAFGINTIGNLIPGQGYTVYVDPTATLNYSVRGKR